LQENIQEFKGSNGLVIEGCEAEDIDERYTAASDDVVDGNIDITIVCETDLVNYKATPELNMSDGFFKLDGGVTKSLSCSYSKS
jgi:hypothetical protein